MKSFSSHLWDQFDVVETFTDAGHATLLDLKQFSNKFAHTFTQFAENLRDCTHFLSAAGAAAAEST